MARTARPAERDALVLDAHPVVAFINGEAGGETVRRLLEGAAAGEVDLRMSVVNAAEVMLAQERIGGAEAGHLTLELLQELPLELVGVDLELAARAAYLKRRGGISFADCFCAALAHRDGVPLLTGDPEFERVADVVRVEWLG